jgi:hypothetical protein
MIPLPEAMALWWVIAGKLWGLVFFALIGLHLWVIHYGPLSVPEDDE